MKFLFSGFYFHYTVSFTPFWAIISFYMKGGETVGSREGEGGMEWISGTGWRGKEKGEKRGERRQIVWAKKGKEERGSQRERAGERETEIENEQIHENKFSIYCFNPQMVVTARLGAGQSQERASSLWFPTWMADAQAIGPPINTFTGTKNFMKNRVAGTRNWCYNTGCWYCKPWLYHHADPILHRSVF